MKPKRSRKIIRPKPRKRKLRKEWDDTDENIMAIAVGGEAKDGK